MRPAGNQFSTKRGWDELDIFAIIVTKFIFPHRAIIDVGAKFEVVPIAEVLIIRCNHKLRKELVERYFVCDRLVRRQV